MEGLGGGFGADTIQPRPVPTALREREDDILPYGGWGILAGTIQPSLYIILVHATPHQSRPVGVPAS